MSLDDFIPEMERCSSCSYCKWIPLDKIKSRRFAEGCPSLVYNNFNAYSARGRYQMSLSLLENRISYSDTVVDVVNKCLTCGSCDVSCKICRYNLQPLEHIQELRARLVEDEQVLPQHIPLINNLNDESTMIPGMTKTNRSKWSEGLKVKNVPNEKADVIFFAGCRYSYDKKMWKIPQAAVNVLINAGVDVGIMKTEDGCCGGRAYQMGFREDFSKAAHNNLKVWESAGVKTVVTSCSDCYHTLKRLYPKLGSQIEVLHTVEYVDSLIKEGKIKFSKPIPMTVTYHDPCHLGRLGEQYIPWNGEEKKIRNQIVVYDPPKPRYNGAFGIYDQPRDVLESIPGIQLVEMERIREYGWCCGAGGGCSDTYPEFSAWTAGERIEEANTTGAEAIVTACPWCESNFNKSIRTTGQKIQVLDIIELVQQAI